ncbi:hypothetical protein HDU76_006789, partial [Blyttiomyces sp. JEL0837]
MLSGAGYGNYMLQMLRALNVNRVALVVGFDSLSRAIAKDAEEAFLKAKITLLTKLSITRHSHKQNDYTSVFNSLKHIDSRYILIFADSDVTTDFYYSAGLAGLIDEHHAWFGYNAPIPQSGDYTDPETPDINTTPSILAFKQSWQDAHISDPSRYPTLQITGLFYAGAQYDCVNVILRGLDKLLNENQSYTPEMLASGELKSILTPDKFADSGFHGVTYDPIMLNEFGDIST